MDGFYRNQSRRCRGPVFLHEASRRRDRLEVIAQRTKHVNCWRPSRNTDAPTRSKQPIGPSLSWVAVGAMGLGT